MSQTKKRTVVITGGGTGGHIYPGLAIAQEIERQHQDIQVHFVGATGGLEEKILPKANFPYHLIKVGRLHRSVGLWQQIKTMCYMPLTLWHAFKIFRTIKPEAVLGVGGFASGPFLLISWLMGTKTALWEPNAYPGLTNRWLSLVVNQNFIVFQEAAKFLKTQKIIEVGLPVRKEFFNQAKPDVTPNIASKKLKVLVFGGSQGARAVNEVVATMIKKYPDILERIQLRHQTGAGDYQRMKALYGEDVQKIALLEYIHDMPVELHDADVVICRSGASTVAEMIACRKPAIFIPLPSAADNHQLKNAEVLANKQAGIVIEQKHLTPEKLRETLLDFCEHGTKIQSISVQLAGFDFANASEKIVKNLMENGL